MIRYMGDLQRLVGMLHGASARRRGLRRRGARVAAKPLWRRTLRVAPGKSPHRGRSPGLGGHIVICSASAELLGRRGVGLG